MAKFRYYSLWLSLTCVLFFLLQLYVPNFESLLILNQSSWTQPWRFVSSIFLHGSTTHLLYNLFALIFFGLVSEKLIGGKRFLIIFFTTGIIANLIAINFYASSLGASGAIFGVIGALTVIRPTMPVFFLGVPLPLIIASVGWVIGDVVRTIYPTNVGTIAHLSGIFFGILFGLWFRFKKTKPKYPKYNLKIPEDYMQTWENNYMTK